MSAAVDAARDAPRRLLAVVAVLVALSPAFAWGAARVGYAEPLENAAELTGASDAAVTLVPALFPDYSVAGLGPYLGTLVAGAVGTALVFVLAVGVGRLLAR
ncbi:PDGLE domain-containing protein [Halomarina ordinaria]|uniref:PDGLE domain-containing protein n=1 Tax=Halomarina ordinaria TaxID=3033939 RepID=A0ABD5UDY7_9EURY|nr:PDGLE domain-containing protein [Halomarina sp. PSRA2]